MTPPPVPLDRGLMILLAVSAFAGAGTIHYQTPMLAAFAAEFGADPGAAGWVATLSFGGFLLGTIFFVPLGDRFDKRRLILAELSVLIVALLAMAAAPSLAMLAGAAFAVGISASFPQLMIPLAAELAPRASRGRIRGFVHRLALDLRDRRRDARRPRAPAPSAAAAQPAAHEPVLRPA